jgi:hypothetical protein
LRSEKSGEDISDAPGTHAQLGHIDAFDKTITISLGGGEWKKKKRGQRQTKKKKKKKKKRFRSHRDADRLHDRENHISVLIQRLLFVLRFFPFLPHRRHGACVGVAYISAVARHQFGQRESLVFGRTASRRPDSRLLLRRAMATGTSPDEPSDPSLLLLLLLLTSSSLPSALASNERLSDIVSEKPSTLRLLGRWCGECVDE